MLHAVSFVFIVAMPPLDPVVVFERKPCGRGAQRQNQQDATAFPQDHLLFSKNSVSCVRLSWLTRKKILFEPAAYASAMCQQCFQSLTKTHVNLQLQSELDGPRDPLIDQPVF
jgi:hypothetical protein